jgi:hypothetical protein
VTNGQVKVAAWVWWLLCGALLIAFPPPDGTVNDLLLLVSALPLGLAYGVPYWRRVYAAYREGRDDESQERATTGH